jgi:hypothetical protein
MVVVVPTATCSNARQHVPLHVMHRCWHAILHAAMNMTAREPVASPTRASETTSSALLCFSLPLLPSCCSTLQEPGAQENEDFADLDEFEEEGGDIHVPISTMGGQVPKVPVAAGDVVVGPDGKRVRIAVVHCQSPVRTAAFEEFKARLERIYPGVLVDGTPTESTDAQKMASYVRCCVRPPLPWWPAPCISPLRSIAPCTTDYTRVESRAQSQLSSENAIICTFLLITIMQCWTVA